MGLDYRYVNKTCNFIWAGLKKIKLKLLTLTRRVWLDNALNRPEKLE